MFNKLMLARLKAPRGIPKLLDSKGYADFKVGVMLRALREESRFTQEELAYKMRTQKSVISRIENKAEDIRISTLFKYWESMFKSR
jgi:HTH-type transcriptional regulator/antitoxin HipB